MISIIIPTLNEEERLPLLLESLRKQNFSDYEIIVADAGSKDRTLDIARENGCKIAKGGLPAFGRNEGARQALGDKLLFLDADVVLPDNFFFKALDEFGKRNLDIASFRLLPLKRGKITSLLFNVFYNFPIVVLEKILPHAAMGILVKKNLFEKTGGFEEDVKMAEDHLFARKASEKGKYGILRSVKILVSERRFEKEGWFLTSLKYFVCGLYMIFVGPVRKDIFGFNLEGYFKNRKNKV